MRTPKNRAEIGRQICAITEKTFPLPREELCIPLADMERELTNYVESVIRAAYDEVVRGRP